VVRLYVVRSCPPFLHLQYSSTNTEPKAGHGPWVQEGTRTTGTTRRGTQPRAPQGHKHSRCDELRPTVLRTVCAAANQLRLNRASRGHLNLFVTSSHKYRADSFQPKVLGLSFLFCCRVDKNKYYLYMQIFVAK
jgi:hypothetical protein